jgi:hypothetical protein
MIQPRIGRPPPQQIGLAGRLASALSRVPYSGGVADYYLVKLARGPDWNHARRRRDQDVRAGELSYQRS